jgi:hypothetical protein
MNWIDEWLTTQYIGVEYIYIYIYIERERERVIIKFVIE